MKVSRSTSRPRRLKKQGASGAIFVLAILAVAGMGYAGHRMGWWAQAPASHQPDAGALNAQAGGGASRANGNHASPPAGVQSAPAPKNGPSETIVPSGAPIPAPDFGKEFDDAIERGAFRDAEAALAGIGGSADADHRLTAAMNAAGIRIASRFEEIRNESGERAAKVYLSHQILNFPDLAPARAALETLLAASERAADPTAVASGGPAASRRAAPPAAPPAGVQPPRQSDAELVSMKDEAVKVMDRGEIKSALSVLREVAAAAEAAGHGILGLEAQRLVRQGEAELRFRDVVVEKVAAKATGDRPVPHLPGESGRVIAADAEGVTFAGQKGEVTLKWRVLPMHTVVAMIPLLGLAPAEMTDAAMMLFRSGRTEDAEALLATAERAAGADVKPAIDQALADARGMTVPAGGFTLVDGKWMSPQQVARHETARGIAEASKKLSSPDAAVRRAAFDAMVSLGDAAKSPLNRALAQRRLEIREEIKRLPIHGKLADLAGRRKELDEARAHALELIEDETRYPYPYRPPEASEEQFKAYQQAQREIDVRMATVRRLWNQKLAVSLPKAFHEKVALLAEISKMLAEIGAPAADDDPAWLAHLPAANEVTLRTIATSEADRRRIDESARIMEENAKGLSKAAPAELHEARVTNDYRIMLGRAALVVHDKLTLAARGHCEDMAKRGFFAHMSPVPGKTTPYDRVMATGMRPIGVSENIAQAGGPDSAHSGWCHSSGHHRNLLSAGWRLIGVGNSGSLWCQNFAAGERTDADGAGDDGDAPERR